MDAYEPIGESIVSQGGGAKAGHHGRPQSAALGACGCCPNPGSVTGAPPSVLTRRAFVRPGLLWKAAARGSHGDGARPGKRPSDSRRLRDLGAGVAGRRCRGCARGCPGKEGSGARRLAGNWCRGGVGEPQCCAAAGRMEGGRKDASTRYGRLPS